MRQFFEPYKQTFKLSHIRVNSNNIPNYGQPVFKNPAIYHGVHGTAHSKNENVYFLAPAQRN